MDSLEPRIGPPLGRRCRLRTLPARNQKKESVSSYTGGMRGRWHLETGQSRAVVREAIRG